MLTTAGTLEEPTSGQVVIDERELAGLSRNERARLRRRAIGCVFQDLNLLPGLTAVENVALPLKLDGVRLLALGALAMTVGLIRGEAARDLLTLTATWPPAGSGAPLAAATALGLAVLGSILGVAVAYLAAAAILDEEIGLLKRMPVIELAVVLVGVPVVAAAASWLLGGREPRSLTREP